MRVGFGDDCQVIRSSKIKKPVGGESCSYLASMLFLQCSPPSFPSPHFPSFPLIPPSLSGVHLHVCLVPVVIALLCQRMTKSKMFSGNEILSLSQPFITFYLRLEFFDTESYWPFWAGVLISTPPSKDGGSFQFWLRYFGRTAYKKTTNTATKVFYLESQGKTSSFLHIAVK